MIFELISFSTPLVVRNPHFCFNEKHTRKSPFIFTSNIPFSARPESVYGIRLRCLTNAFVHATNVQLRGGGRKKNSH